MRIRDFPGASIARLIAVFLARRGYLWMPAYLIDRIKKRNIENPPHSLVDLIFCIVDHFEPARSRGKLAVNDVNDWCDRYENIARKYIDSSGIKCQHTWFYRYDFPNLDCVRRLARSASNGFGEIEFHLHHAYDTPTSFSAKIDEGLEWFSKSGAMLTAESIPQHRFGYIAGDWALDNGRRDPAYSGVNTELSILNRLGCYADFTFPAYGETSQPRIVNQIYHTNDTPSPKSYDRGEPYQIGKITTSDLTIFEGPTFIDWKTGYVEMAALESFHPYESKRLKYWQKAHVHVSGRPEWIFVKLHTHGMQSKEMILGEQLEHMLHDITKLRDTDNTRVHYVTAREAYNIAKAAEAGMSGNPSEYRDYQVSRPVNRQLFCNTEYKARKCSESDIELVFPHPSKETQIFLNNGPVREISGTSISRCQLTRDNDGAWTLALDGSNSCTYTVTSPQGIDIKNTIELPNTIQVK